MSLSDVIRLLAERGIVVSARRVHYAIEQGYIPRPPKNGACAYVFSKKHANALCRKFGVKGDTPTRPAGNAKAAETQSAASAA